MYNIQKRKGAKSTRFYGFFEVEYPTTEDIEDLIIEFNKVKNRLLVVFLNERQLHTKKELLKLGFKEIKSFKNSTTHRDIYYLVYIPPEQPKSKKK